MIPADTLRVVDTVWLAVQRQPAGFVEIATAWSTVAVAAFALVALFLPWWERRRHRAAVDARVGATAADELALARPAGSSHSSSPQTSTGRRAMTIAAGTLHSSR